jgi:hypothetical protein
MAQRCFSVPKPFQAGLWVAQAVYAPAAAAQLRSRRLQSSSSLEALRRQRVDTVGSVPNRVSGRSSPESSSRSCDAASTAALRDGRAAVRLTEWARRVAGPICVSARRTLVLAHALRTFSARNRRPLERKCSGDRESHASSG